MSQNKVYWEKQESSFCAVHALNSLLQGAYFTEIDLSTIAQRIDEAEKQIMAENGLDTPEFLRFVARDRDESDNVNSSGNFSIQVINEALKVWGLVGMNVGSEDAKQARDAPEFENAFICNLGSHWFTIRKMWGIWFNLNSLLAAPQVVTPFYMSVYLSELRRQGYDVFVVKGDFPSVNVSLDGRGQWIPCSAIKGAGGAAVQRSTSDEEFKMAVALSMSESMPSVNSGQSAVPQKSQQQPDDDEDDPDLAAALRMSMQTEESPVDSRATEVVDLTEEADSTDALNDDLLLAGDENATMATAHQVEDLSLQIIFADGTKKQARFPSNSTASQVYSFCQSEKDTLKGAKFHLQSMDPKMVLPNDRTSLYDFGVRQNTTFRVRVQAPSSNP